MAVIEGWSGLGLWTQVGVMLIAAAVCACVTVLALRIDERTDRSVDPGYRLLFPTIDRAVSAIKVAVRYLAVGGVAALVGLWVWHAVAPLAGALLEPGRIVLAGPYRALMPGLVAATMPVQLGLDALRARRAPRYGMFVSYRSIDAPLARELADLLSSAGVRVWFAEYEILLSGRERFARAIDRGVRESVAAIAVTSEEYFASEHCMREMEGLARTVGTERILEVRARTLSAATAARSPVPAGQVLGSSVGAVLERFEERSGMRVPRSLRSSGFRTVTVGECLGRPVTLDVGDWQEHEPGGALPAFRFGEGLPVLANLAWGPELAPEARLRDVADDRAMYDELMRYAATYMGGLSRRLGGGLRGPGRTRVAGVHLLFWGGASQLGLTYHNGLFWCRKVSIVARNPVTAEYAEFVFTFGCPLPYAEYLRHTAEMDRFATSLRWE